MLRQKRITVTIAARARCDGEDESVDCGCGPRRNHPTVLEVAGLAAHESPSAHSAMGPGSGSARGRNTWRFVRVLTGRNPVTHMCALSRFRGCQTVVFGLFSGFLYRKTYFESRASADSATPAQGHNPLCLLHLYIQVGQPATPQNTLGKRGFAVRAVDRGSVPRKGGLFFRQQRSPVSQTRVRPSTGVVQRWGWRGQYGRGRCDLRSGRGGCRAGRDWPPGRASYTPSRPARGRRPAGRQTKRWPAGPYGGPSNSAPIKNPRTSLVQWITRADSQLLGSSGANSRT